MTLKRPKTALLLLQLGTPKSPGISDVRQYLEEFLSDPRVLDMPAWKRWLLLHGIILRFRPRKTAHAYQSIWDSQRGSPLLFHSQSLVEKLRDRMPEVDLVLVAMRYGFPSIQSAVEQIHRAAIEEIVVLPMYPQYASSTTGTAVEKLFECVSKLNNVPSLRVIPPFYNQPAYITATASQAKGLIDEDTHVLFSFHGLPEQHILASDPTGDTCLKQSTCCDQPTDANRYCYRAHCIATASSIAEILNLPKERYHLSFQSRLGRQPWLKPYTDKTLGDLAKKGIKKVAVFCPSFTADCLETLEEMNIRGKKSFLTSGGESFLMVPSLNDSDEWVQAISEIVSF